MSTVPQNNARPILARVKSLKLIVHFDRIRYFFLRVLYDHHSKLRISQCEQFTDIGQANNVAVHERGPTFLANERNAESGYCKLRRHWCLTYRTPHPTVLMLDWPREHRQFFQP